MLGGVAMFQKDFKPILRFVVMSDVHYDDEKCIEEERVEKALKIAYRLSEESEYYKKLDAVYVVGDFANSGTEIQMRKFKKNMEENLKDGTQYILTMASHEFRDAGVEGAYKRFNEIFEMPVDQHKVINGFHFISITPSSGCEFNAEKKAYAQNELKIAREYSPKKPIFFFQHPHITDTVSGSIYWGDESFYPILMDYPQVIDFSGHSHAPINDPRSVYQKHFTAFGTGSLSYYELDEFDKYYGTKPPKDENCAQMLIVEADENGRVRVYPYDVLTDNFFAYTWEIDEPWNPDSFKYTDARYKNATEPYFENDAKINITEVTSKGFSLEFPQAKCDDPYVNDYKVAVVEKESGLIIKQACFWSDYYFYNMPKTLSYKCDSLKSDTEYTVKITAGTFWNTYSKPITAEFKTEKECNL